MALKTFDLTKVAVTIDDLPITGFQDGDAIEFSFNDDLYEKKVGADGSVTRAAKNDRTAQVTLNLLYTSEANTVLNDLLKADRSDGSGAKSLLVEDTSGAFRFFAPEAWVMKHPDFSMGQETPALEWVLDTSQAEVDFLGIPSPNLAG